MLEDTNEDRPNWSPCPSTDFPAVSDRDNLVQFSRVLNEIRGRPLLRLTINYENAPITSVTAAAIT